MSEETPAIVGIAALAIDCTDPPRLAHWWSHLLGGTVEVHPQGYATLHTSEGLALDFLPVPEPKTGKNRLHLDLRAQVTPSQAGRRCSEFNDRPGKIARHGERHQEDDAERH